MDVSVCFLLPDYPEYCEKSLLFRINFLDHIIASLENRVMQDASHAQNLASVQFPAVP